MVCVCRGDGGVCGVCVMRDMCVQVYASVCIYVFM